MRRGSLIVAAGVSFLAACAPLQDASLDRSAAASEFEATLPRPEIAPVLAETRLGRAVSARLLSGPTLSAARAGERVAEARLADQRAAMGPSVSLGASAVASTGSNPALQPTLLLTQLLYDGGASAFSIAASAARTDAADATTRTRLTARALDAVRAWEDLYRAGRLLVIARASLARMSEIEDRVALRRSSGAGRAAETLRVAARRADAAATLARAEGELLATQARFSELFGSSNADGPVPTAPQMSAGLASSPRLSELQAELRAAKAELGARVAERAPAVFMDVTGGLDDDDEPALAAGLRLDYSFDSSGRRTAAIDAARAEVARLEAELTLAESDLRRAVSYAASREAALLAESRAITASEKAARQALENAEASFATGRIDILDLLDLGRDLDQAASRRIAVDAKYRLAGYERLAASGVLLDVFGIDVSGVDR